MQKKEIKFLVILLSCNNLINLQTIVLFKITQKKILHKSTILFKFVQQISSLRQVIGKCEKIAIGIMILFIKNFLLLLFMALK